MSRKNRRAYTALLKKVIPYAKKLNEWAKTQPKMPTDPVRAARFYENQTGIAPPVPYDILGNFLKGPADRKPAAEPVIDALMRRMNELSGFDPPENV